jgi:hypothetical protein
VSHLDFRFRSDATGEELAGGCEKGARNVPRLPLETAARKLPGVPVEGVTVMEIAMHGIYHTRVFTHLECSRLEHRR